MSNYQLAQLNIAHAKGATDSAVMQGFVTRIDEINQLAEHSDGFVWRFDDAYQEKGEALAVFGDPLLLVNMSVWRDLQSLKTFVYKTAHIELLKNRQLWFNKMTETNQVLWWLDKGKIPTLAEAKAKLDYLTKYGASDQAFTFSKTFIAPLI